jgi:hypothetical protein
MQVCMILLSSSDKSLHSAARLAAHQFFLFLAWGECQKFSRWLNRSQHFAVEVRDWLGYAAVLPAGSRPHLDSLS